jgi:serine/threonine protein kinase
MNKQNDWAFGQLEEEIFAKAIEIRSTNERARFLDEVCGPNTHLRAQLDQWLAEFDQPDEMFSNPNSVMDQLRPDDNQPVRVGEFEIICEIGRGGMGVVYEAQQTSLHRRVALKVLAVGLSFSKSAFLRFQREAEVAAKLHHTNIVPVYTTGVQDEIPYYAMELVEGPSLEEVLRQMRVASSMTEHSTHVTDDATRIRWAVTKNGRAHATSTRPQGRGDIVAATSTFGQGRAYFDNLANKMAEVAEGLDHAHSHGIIHRDVKPSNLLLSSGGDVVISDFGMARILDGPGLTNTGELMGSPRYMSPEQISADYGSVDKRTDVYSLGVTLYEFLTLRTAYEGEDRAKVLHQVLHTEPKPPRKLNPRIPVDLETICRKAMDKHPARRYQSCHDMADDLRRFVNRHQISARRIGPFGSALRWCRRNRAVAILAAALLIVVTTAVVGMIASQLKTERAFAKGLAIIDSYLESNSSFEALRKIDQVRSEFGPRPELLERLNDVSPEFTIQSNYADATILIKPIERLQSDWLELGKLTKSPLRVRLPKGSYLAKVVAPSSNDLLLEIPSDEDAAFEIIAPTHDDMVRLRPELTGRRIAWRRQKYFPKLEEFAIDRYEVTNAAFHRFVEDGGYTEKHRTLWADLLGNEHWQDVVKTFVDQSRRAGPRFWKNGLYPVGMEDHPVVGVSWYEAMAYAKWADKQLPTVYHWLAASALTGDHLPHDLLMRSNIGFRDAVPRANRNGAAHMSVTSFGTFDMVGNVKEWCLNEEAESRRFALGGSWQDDLVAGDEPYSVSPLTRAKDIGFRCAVFSSPDELSDPMAIQWRSFADVSGTLPPIEECRSLFSGYPRNKPWRTTTKESVWIDGIFYDVFQVDTANDENDRMLIYVAYPSTREFSPPYETVVIGDLVWFDFERGVPHELKSDMMATLLSRGRAVVLPLLFGVGDRFDYDQFPPYSSPPDKVDAYGRTVINIAKDYSRTIDFIERFEEATGQKSRFDVNRLAFCGIGWGGCVGPIWMVADFLSHDDTWRVKAAILVNAGLVQCLQPPNVDQMTYLPHLKIPTLVLNCKLLAYAPFERAQMPMFQLLGVDESRKQITVYPQFQRMMPAKDFGLDANRWLDDHLSEKQ